MKYHIDTIPVWDALKLDGECLFCALRRKTELSESERYLGASVMEPDTRILVNKLGFCQKHQAMLFATSNRLGHALMLHTHLMETEKNAADIFASIKKTADVYGASSLGDKLTGKAAAAKKELIAKAQKLQNDTSTCVMCNSIEDNMARYIHTFFHLYANDSEFRRIFSESKGVCMHDASILIEAAPDELDSKTTASFINVLIDLQEKNLKRTEEDIAWFIRKYDYRFDAEPWKNSRDAVERTVNKLRGWCIGQ